MSQCGVGAARGTVRLSFSGWPGAFLSHTNDVGAGWAPEYREGLGLHFSKQCFSDKPFLKTPL